MGGSELTLLLGCVAVVVWVWKVSCSLRMECWGQVTSLRSCGGHGMGGRFVHQPPHGQKDLVAPWFWDLLRKKFFLRMRLEKRQPKANADPSSFVFCWFFFSFLHFSVFYRQKAVNHLKTSHFSVRPIVQEGFSTGWRFSPSAAAGAGTVEASPAQPLCEGWEFFFGVCLTHGLI